MKVEMTGKEDREGPWKIALAGFPGSGKTLFGSTAPAPLFVFFQDNPRIKSIANRYIPHVKLVNEANPGVVTVQDRLNGLVISLNTQDHGYKTLVIDTGDELFQGMKQGRRLKNGGEFGVGDWGWIADAYREVVTSLIDLPMNVLVLYHLKSSQDGDEGHIVRELMLQGAVQDEAPGWFDVMGVLDTFETTNDEGDTVTKRAILTHSSRMYPWLKDHSGDLPMRFTLSDDFVGDFDRFMALLTSSDDLASKEVLEDLEVPSPPVTEQHNTIPSPEDLQAKKEEIGGQEPVTPDTPPGEDSSVEEPSPEEPEVLVEDTSVLVEEAVPLVEEEVTQGEPAVETILPESEETIEMTEEQQQESPSELVEKELGAVAVVTCADCGIEVDDNDLIELTQIRFRANLCRDHFKARIAEARGA